MGSDEVLWAGCAQGEQGYGLVRDEWERNLACGWLTEYGADMSEKQPPPPLPIVPLNAATLAANVAFVEYVKGNGSIMLNVADLRSAPIKNVGDPPQDAIFEVGRFMLTPRALRQLLDAANAAAAAYAETAGEPLPKVDQFMARAAMTTLIPPMGQPPKQDENQG